MTETTATQPLKSVLQVDDVEPHEVAPGILYRTLQTTDNAWGWVIDFAPGTEWPRVDHHETEERYFVLSGVVIDGDDNHGPGAYIVFAPGSRHQPRTETGARMLGINMTRV